MVGLSFWNLELITIKFMKKLSITIGISAYNEENNIKNLLESVLIQSTKNIILKEIIIISDGSKDNTVREIKLINDSRIKLFSHRKRAGKSNRMNEIFRKFTSDILVLLDGDIVLGNNKVLEEVAKPFIKDAEIGLVGGKTEPFIKNNYIVKAINLTIKCYVNYTETINNGDNVYACKGAFVALSKKFAKNLSIPKEVVSSDTYQYLSCIKQGFKFKYVRSTKVYYHLPQTLRDHVKQNKRFVSARHEMEKYFGNLVNTEFEKNRLKLYQ